MINNPSEEICENCGKAIQRSEKAFVFNDKIVCGKCDERLRNPGTVKGKQKIYKAGILIVCFIAVAVVVSLAYSRFFRSNISLTVQETPLGESQSGDYVIVSADGKRVAILDRNRPDRKNVFIIDGKAGPAYDDSFMLPHELHDLTRSFVFSPDGQRYMYKCKRGNKSLVVLDGIEQKEYDSVDDLIFSPDSKRAAYKGRVEGKWRIVIDSKEGMPHASGMFLRNPVFSSDGNDLAYVIGIAKKSMSVVVNGKEGKSYRYVGRPKFSPVSGKVTYPAAKNNRKWVIVTGEIEGEEYDNIGKEEPTFSPQGRRMAYTANKGDKWLIVTDGIESKPFDKISRAYFSPDENHVMFAAMENNKHYVSVDGEVGPGYDAVNSMTFSPDSRRTAYVGKTNLKWTVVVDGVEQPANDGITDLAFSPDSKRFAYLAKLDDKGFLVTDGAKGDIYNGTGCLTISPDSVHIAFLANTGSKKITLEEDDYDTRQSPQITGKDLFGTPIMTFREEKFPNSKGMKKMREASGKLLTVMDGRNGKIYETVANLTFSPDSKRYVYWASEGDKWAMVVDGEEVAVYDGLISGSLDSNYYVAGKGVSYPKSKFVFNGPTQFQTLAWQDNSVLKVEVQFKE